MESLQLTDFEIDKSKNTYYYDKYPYKMMIYCVGIEHSRRCYTEDELETKLNRLFSYFSYSRHNDEIRIKENFDKMVSILSIKNENKDRDDIKFTTSRGVFTIYSTKVSDLISFHEQLKSANLNIRCYATTRIQNYSKDVVYLKSSPHQYRAFMNSIVLTTDEITDLYTYFKRNDIRMSPTFIKWYRCNYKNASNKFYTWITMFFDLNDESQITYLSLKYPRLVRKICKIEKR